MSHFHNPNYLLFIAYTPSHLCSILFKVCFPSKIAYILELLTRSREWASQTLLLDAEYLPCWTVATRKTEASEGVNGLGKENQLHLSNCHLYHESYVFLLCWVLQKWKIHEVSSIPGEHKEQGIWLPAQNFDLIPIKEDRDLGEGHQFIWGICSLER